MGAWRLCASRLQHADDGASICRVAYQLSVQGLCVVHACSTQVKAVSRHTLILVGQQNVTIRTLSQGDQ